MKSYLDPVEVERLEGAARNSRDRLLVHMLFHLGCRVSEALAMAVEDVDLEAKTVTIQHLKQRIKLLCPKCAVRLSRAHRFCPGCGAGVEEAVARQTEHRRMRVLPVDQATMQMLRQFIEVGGPALRGERHPLFHINRHRAWQVVKECAERAGLGKLLSPETGRLRGVSPHRLRDAFAVHAMKTEW